LRRLPPFLFVETASLLDSSLSSGSRPVLLLGLFEQRVRLQWRQGGDFRVVSKGQNVPAPEVSNLRAAAAALASD